MESFIGREMPASQKSALESVMEADQERIKLEKLAEELAVMEDDDAQDYLMEVSSNLAPLFTRERSKRKYGNASFFLSVLYWVFFLSFVKCCRSCSHGPMELQY